MSFKGWGRSGEKNQQRCSHSKVFMLKTQKRAGWALILKLNGGTS